MLEMEASQNRGPYGPKGIWGVLIGTYTGCLEKLPDSQRLFSTGVYSPLSR